MGKDYYSKSKHYSKNSLSRSRSRSISRDRRRANYSPKRDRQDNRQKSNDNYNYYKTKNYKTEDHYRDKGNDKYSNHANNKDRDKSNYNRRSQDRRERRNSPTITRDKYNNKESKYFKLRVLTLTADQNNYKKDSSNNYYNKENKVEVNKDKGKFLIMYYSIINSF